METVKKYFRIDRRQLAFIKFIFEGYEGIAVISTLEPELGIVQMIIAPGCEETADMILRDLKKSILIEAAEPYVYRTILNKETGTDKIV